MAFTLSNDFMMFTQHFPIVSRLKNLKNFNNYALSIITIVSFLLNCQHLYMVLQHQNFQHIQLKYLIYKKLQLFKMSNLITLFVFIRIWSICLKTLVAKSTCYFSLVQLTKMDFLTM